MPEIHNRTVRSHKCSQMSCDLPSSAVTEGDGSIRLLESEGNLHYSVPSVIRKTLMPSIALSMKGQVTLKRDLLAHLGVKPGERIEIEKLPGGELRIRAVRATGTIGNFIGRHAGKSKKALTIEEMNEIAAEGWSGDR
jgi:antitoxin PrlF